ncbi:MAG: PilZ domain-containing protein [Phycisphaeraceae bacterium]|nr:PilZ domain-containing protein [Phycisphaeraceae bacterium]MCW5754026.1 PilZ domain-containing protein [Phycisphaeraceae bacterium]
MPAERRRSPRVPSDRACKLFHAPSLRFLPGRTRNQSADGFLIDIPPTNTLHPGDPLRFALDDHPLLAHDALAPARIVRCEYTPHRLTLAITLEPIA